MRVLCATAPSMPDPFAHRYLWRRLAGRMVWRYPAPMTERKTDPIRPTDDDARDQARALIAQARFAALGVIDPATGAPMVTRIAAVTNRSCSRDAPALRSSWRNAVQTPSGNWKVWISI